MKYLVVIGDGMADNPVEALGGKTPLEYADIPTIDSLAARGTVGSVVNCPKPLHLRLRPAQAFLRPLADGGRRHRAQARSRRRGVPLQPRRARAGRSAL